MQSDGELKTLSHCDDDKEMFQAACLSLGALGIIVSIKLQCERAFNLHQVTYAATLDDVRGISVLKLERVWLDYARCNSELSDHGAWDYRPMKGVALKFGLGGFLSI